MTDALYRINRLLDALERRSDLASHDEALHCLGLRVAGLRTTIMERRFSAEADARVRAMFPSLYEERAA